MNPICENQIMIVDDDPDVREALREVLEDCAYSLVEATNGREAIDTLRGSKVKPCAIVLDIMMPVMDGWQFRELQRQDPALDEIPVIALTATPNLKEVEARLAPGACLKKPVQIDALLAALARFCRDRLNARARADLPA